MIPAPLARYLYPGLTGALRLAVVLGATVLVQALSPWGLVGTTLLAAAAGLAGFVLVEWLVFRAWPAGLSPGAAGGLPWGALAGMGLFGLTYLALWLPGWAEPAGPLDLPILLPTAGLMLAIAVTEELIFRGILFPMIQSWIGPLGALIATAALFGMLHWGNPHATPLSSLAIAIEAGGMLGLAYLVTRSLWLPIGLHAGWNLAETLVGVPLSGHDLPGLFTTALTGPAWATGGAFGPEAGVPALLVCLGACAVLARRLRR